MLKRLLALFMLLGIVSFLPAQTAGKISGIVKDADTGEALPGVNVVLQETFLGASTDVDGFFVILNVPPGTYTVSFSYVGYQPVDIEQVRVVTDITKRLDVQLKSTSIELDSAIVVVAEKPFFEASATNTVRVLDAEEIERVPVKGVNSIVSINAGVVIQDGSGGQTDNATINVRGGRGNETLIVVDGVPFNDLLFGNATGTIPDVAIEQVSSQLGGFSAKYGSAQSGIVNIVTKSGSSRFFGGGEGITSENLDDYGYNVGNGFLGGPIIPGSSKYTFFFSGEYIQADDDDPRAVGIDIPATPGFDAVHHKILPGNESKVTRLTGKLDGNFGNLKATLSGNASLNDRRVFVNSYAKSNWEHNPRIDENSLGGSLRLSHIIDPTTFWDATFRLKVTDHERGDGIWFDDLLAYGDSAKNASIGTILTAEGQRVDLDDNAVFFKHGRVNDFYRKYNIQTLGGELNFTKQLEKHLIEIGGTVERSTVRLFEASPVKLASFKNQTLQERFNQSQVDTRFFGYDITGQSKLDNDRFITLSGDEILEAGAKKPVTISVYAQDKIEFQDFILNLGVRYDYFDQASQRLKDPHDILGDDRRLSRDDFEDAPTEQYVSPRVGFAFPVSERTVFHAQYGIFRQQPTFFELYDSWTRIDRLEQDSQFTIRTGHLKSEATTQYEFGFKQQFANVASLDITAFYKNIKNLIDIASEQTTFGSASKQYLSYVNLDFGTVKGLAFSFNLRRLGPISTKVDYTLNLAEGTGSSTTSSLVAAFRNTNGETPIAIAPLDFDQRHTLTASVDVRAGKGEGPSLGGLKILQNAGVNMLFTYNSGRPYTPLAFVDLTSSAFNFGETTEYINTRRGPGIFRLDLRVDKNISFGRVSLQPYLWVQNLLDRDNVINVYQSTGEPDNSAFLDTPEGDQKARGTGHEEGFRSDYKALEKDPTNYGLPRLIRAGLKLKF